MPPRRRPAAPLAAAAVLAAVLPVAGAPAFAHSGPRHAADETSPTPPAFRVEKVSEHVWCLFGQGGNVGILATDAGVVVVDDQYETTARGIVDEIRKISDKPIRWLVNTHYHGDHTGGNGVFQPLTTIVAHETVRPRLLEYPRVVLETFPGKMQAIHAQVAAIADEKDPFRDALSRDLGLMKYLLDTLRGFDPAKVAAPSITFKDSMTVWLGDQPVEIRHGGPGHTDGDSVVYFPKEKVVHMGDLLFNGVVPFIDTLGGGSARGYVRNLNEVLERLPADTRVIAGHGPVTDVTGLRRARDFMRDLQLEVERAVRKGLTREEAARTVTLDAYTDVKPVFRTVANDVLAFYDEIRSKKN